jgi:superfamily II DNA helicase RecQ
MPFAFIQVPANGQGDAKEALNRLLRGGRIASVRKEFVAHGEDSFWAFCIEYLDPGPLSDGEGRPGGRNERVDYKQILAPEIFAVFSRLRAVRKELAEKEAIPAYAFFTNEQLA